MKRAWWLAFGLCWSCGGSGEDAGAPMDIGFPDSGVVDAAPTDASDGGGSDADSGATDNGFADAQPEDALPEDALPEDAQPDAEPLDADPVDADPIDATSTDAVVNDATPTDSGPPTSGLDWSWSPHATGPTRMIDHVVTGFDRRMFVLGGRAPTCVTQNLIYDPYADTYATAVGDSFLSLGILIWNGAEIFAGGNIDCSLAHDPVYDLFTWNPETDALDDVSGEYSLTKAVALNDTWFGPVGECLNPPCPAWALYDRASGSWQPVGAGGPSAFSVLRLLSAGGRVLAWTTNDDFVIYNLALDLWTPVAPPPMPLSMVAPVSLSIGDEVFIWDGVFGVRYDVIADTWSLADSTDAPTGASPLGVWTGSEVVILDDVGGAHYDPSLDQWRPINARGRYWPPLDQYETRLAAWTGEEMVVYGGAAGSGRYGPRSIPNEACMAPAPGLDLRILQPLVTRKRNAGEQQPVEVEVDSALSIQRIEWSVDGNPVLQGATGTLDLSALPFGPHQLEVEVEDITGQIICDDRILYVDRLPELTVVEPVPYQIVGNILTIDALCADDGAPCAITASIGPLDLDAVDALSTSIDVSAFDHSLQQLTIAATDARGQRVVQTIPVHVESSPATSDTFFAGGEICHARGGRALLVHDDQFFERDLITGVESPIAIATTSAPECSTARIGESGSVLDFNPGSALYFWDLGAIALQWVGSGLQVQGRWALSRNPQLQLRELGPNTLTDLGATSVATQLYLADDGTVLFGDTSFNINRFVPGGAVSTVTTLSAPPANLLLRGGAGQAIWREGSAGTWSIRRHDGTAITTVAGPSNAWGSSGPGAGDLAAAGDWVVYTRPDALGVLQVWIAASGAAPSIVTGFGDPTRVAGVDEDGDVAYRRAGSTWVWRRATGTHTEVLTDQARVYAEGSRLWLIDGDQIRAFD